MMIQVCWFWVSPFSVESKLNGTLLFHGKEQTWFLLDVPSNDSIEQACLKDSTCLLQSLNILQIHPIRDPIDRSNTLTGMKGQGSYHGLWTNSKQPDVRHCLWLRQISVPKPCQLDPTGRIKIWYIYIYIHIYTYNIYISIVMITVFNLVCSYLVIIITHDTNPNERPRISWAFPTSTKENDTIKPRLKTKPFIACQMAILKFTKTCKYQHDISSNI